MVPRVPRQARSRAKYRAILEAALDLFGELGYTETTIDAIVERSGVSVGVFYSYFASKQQLLISLFQQETIEDDDSIFSLPQQPLTIQETEALIWKFIRQRSGLQRARQELLLINPEFAQHERAYHQRRLQRLARELELRRTTGHIRQDVQTTTSAWVLLAIFARLVEMGDELSEQEIAPEVSSVARLIYHMLHTDEGVI